MLSNLENSKYSDHYFSWGWGNLVPRAFARFKGSGTGNKGPGKHWSRVSKNIGHFFNLALLRSCHPGGGDKQCNGRTIKF
jgi:hypothetical protein